VLSVAGDDPASSSGPTVPDNKRLLKPAIMEKNQIPSRVRLGTCTRHGPKPEAVLPGWQHQHRDHRRAATIADGG
jgi:hypothetical protein